MLGRIDEPVADMRQILARHAELARISLRAHGQDDVGCIERIAPGRLHLKPPALLLHRFHLGVEDDVQLFLVDVRAPRRQDRLARSGLERHLATRRNQHRLGHDVLARLVRVDRVGEVVGPLEQHVRQSIGLGV